MNPLYQEDKIELVQVLGRSLAARPTAEFTSKEEMRRQREQTFDDKLFFGKAQYFHIDRIEVFMRDGFIQGFSLTYNMDGIKMTKVNRGKKMPKTSYELTIAPNEHIEFMQYRFSDEGIYEVVLKTSEGRMLMMDE